ncbi:MAG: DUF1798 family protein [Bacillus sp. (in: firmicutes)]
MKEQALLYTENLRKLLEEIQEMYEDTRKTKAEHDFYTVIEPFVNGVRERADQWQEAINRVVAANPAYFVGERQIGQVVDNICTLSIQAFQHTASYSRFKSYYQSTMFLLKTIERQLR